MRDSDLLFCKIIENREVIKYFIAEFITLPFFIDPFGNILFEVMSFYHVVVS